MENTFFNTIFCFVKNYLYVCVGEYTSKFHLCPLTFNTTKVRKIPDMTKHFGNFNIYLTIIR